MKIAEILLFIVMSLTAFACNDSFRNITGGSNKNSAQEASNPLANFDAKESAIASDKSKLQSGIDLVIAMDTSGSMNDERLAVEENISDLLLALQKSDLDPYIHVMAGGRERRRSDDSEDEEEVFTFPVGIEVARAALVARRIGSHDALGHIAGLLAGEYDDLYIDVNGEPMLEPLPFREDAQLELLVVTDDNAAESLNDESEFGRLADNFDPENNWKATVSGIIGLPDSNESEGSCSIAQVGEEYIALAKKTGGSLLDICAEDWSDLLKRFSTDVKKRSASILLSKVPQGADRIAVTLNGKPLAPEAWTYSEKENRVYLAPGTGFTPGMSLEARYIYDF